MASFDNPSNFPINLLRLIPFERFPGKLNMTIDYYLSMTCQRNDVPIFRFYGWSPFCVSIGYHQKDELVDFAKLDEDGYNFVKRPTGGRAILHAEELTYSVIVPRDLIHHRQLYHFIHQLFADALESLGYQVELKDDNQETVFAKIGSEDTTKSIAHLEEFGTIYEEALKYIRIIHSMVLSVQAINFKATLL